MEEIWKDIKDYEDLYQVSNLGRVKSIRRKVNNNRGIMIRQEKILTPEITKHGYLRIKLFKNNKGKRILIHRLVAETFISNPENKPQVNHIDFNRANNKVDNLEWVSASENIKYSFDKGRIKLPYNVYENIRKQGSIYGKKNGEKCSKKIIQQDLEGNLVKEWESINKAGRELEISIGHISDCLKGRRKTYKGYIWKYK